jgi:hypothetical protein
MGEREEFDEMYEAMEPREQAAMKASMAALLVCMLAMPTALSVAAGRAPPGGVGEFFFDAVVFELAGALVLVFWPLKAWLKPRIHGDATRAPAPAWAQAGLTAAWMALMAAVLGGLAPQLFFTLTGRGVAAGWGEWVRDAGAMLLALAPAALAMGPWVWAVRRAHRRGRDGAT